MEIFKLFEATMADLQPGLNIKHLRRDQLLDNYEASAKTLQTLIRAKESELAYRKDLIKMLEESKGVYDNKLTQVKQDYQVVKSNVPASLDVKSIARLDSTILNERSTTPPMPPPPSPPALKQDHQRSAQIGFQPNDLAMGSMGQQQPQPLLPPPSQPMLPSSSAANNHHQMLAPPPPLHPLISTNQSPGASTIPIIMTSNPVPWTPNSSQSSTRSSELDNIPFPPMDNHDNRSSLDRRLSEFLKTFPNISQAGLVPPSNIDTTKPPPGYYTQQPPQPMLQPSPTAVPPPSHHHHQNQHHHNHHSRR